MLYYTCRKVERENSKPFGFAYRREGRIDPYVHNNPPKILHLLSLISPSFKINHSALQERLRFVLCLVYSYLFYYSLRKQTVERSAVFLLYINRTDGQPFLSMVQGRPSNHFIAPWRVNPRIIRPRVSYYCIAQLWGSMRLGVIISFKELVKF